MPISTKFQFLLNTGTVTKFVAFWCAQMGTLKENTGLKWVIKRGKSLWIGRMSFKTQFRIDFLGPYTSPILGVSCISIRKAWKKCAPWKWKKCAIFSPWNWKNVSFFSLKRSCLFFYKYGIVRPGCDSEWEGLALVLMVLFLSKIKHVMSLNYEQSVVW